MGWDGGTLYVTHADGCIINEAYVDMSQEFAGADIHTSSVDFTVYREGARSWRCDVSPWNLLPRRLRSVACSSLLRPFGSTPRLQAAAFGTRHGRAAMSI